ncbi:hybrid sensor histidine kinase/response regulator [Butyrivibrio sp. WCD2001]|uniref:hybrid sensor histidine kinase/response regulator n=1 Tax=Butyrivibrio sp. WCD2001 TaxID=1280681 RepID=UPI00041A8A3C|nr:ATP-binding protein [Butyrivibrio sp. WCD2001]
MDRKSNNIYIISLVSISCIAMLFEGIALGWEFWVPPLIVIGTVALWVMHITEKPEESIREVCYLLYAMMAVFFHGVHETSYVDIAIVVCFVMVAYSLLDRIYMMNLLLAEYVFLFLIQIWLGIIGTTVVFDFLTISRTLLHFVAVLYVYTGCRKSIHGRLEMKELLELKDDYIDAYDRDIEDFLSNISHELRTPVNVVNGMSELILKRGQSRDAEAIKEAGVRLSSQIEDIQDYTETRRSAMILEEENYMSTSLINDVVTSFRMEADNTDLELIVDMSPDVPTMMCGDVKKLHKIFHHLLGNALKFTRQGGIFVRLFSEKMDYGVNLCIEVTDTGIGMSRKAIATASNGLYQANKKRNRSSGGVGLGLSIVYGFVHRMDGFVKIESDIGKGTTVRVTIPQKVVDATPCLKIDDSFSGDILFHVRSDKYLVAKVRDFYRAMATNLAAGIHVPLYPAETIHDIERLRQKLNVTFIFMGQEEYLENSEYFDELSKGDVVIAVSADHGFKTNPGSRVMIMPKPLYAYPVVKILNEGLNAEDIELIDSVERPNISGLKALVVDDEPMNLVVATGLFEDYGMVIETAKSGKEAITKFKNNDYDIVFMDHMMPEMDGVEAMHRIKFAAEEKGRTITVIALTANVVSGAREMFANEGFDGFVGKPINLIEFERVMSRVLSRTGSTEGGAKQ